MKKGSSANWTVRAIKISFYQWVRSLTWRPNSWSLLITNIIFNQQITAIFPLHFLQAFQFHGACGSTDPAIRRKDSNKKAVLSQRWPCDVPYIWVPLIYVSSQSRTKVKLRLLIGVFFVGLLVTTKFPHVPLEVGGWPLSYEERRCWANCTCN